jgi:hypothetical protein
VAGYASGKTFFKDAQEYLDNLRDSLIPLAIPLGAIGLTGGGVAYGLATRWPARSSAASSSASPSR